MNEQALISSTMPLSTDANKVFWGQLYGCAKSLAIAEAIKSQADFNVIITPDTLTAMQLEYELRFFLNDAKNILHFPEWETLPFDSFSPHQDIISQRLSTLSLLPRQTSGILITPITSLMNRIAPVSYLQANSLLLSIGDKLDPTELTKTLSANAYHRVEQVVEHGEFAIRGAIVDIFPMGCDKAYRIELFDDEVESIRSFDPESQRSIEKIEKIELLPAKEFPLSDEAIATFRTNWRERFHGNPAECAVYQDITEGLATPGIEYFIPLFFDETSTLLDYIPENTQLFLFNDSHEKSEAYWSEISKRHEQLSHDVIRPILSPNDAFLPASELFEKLKSFKQVVLQEQPIDNKSHAINFASDQLPDLNIHHKAKNPLENLENYLDSTDNRVLICAETAGRREALLALLKEWIPRSSRRMTDDEDSHPPARPEDPAIKYQLHQVENWSDFLASDKQLCMTVFPLDTGLVSNQENIAIIAEPQLFGEKVLQRRRRKQQQRDTDLLIKNLAELREGDPVVHIDHGVGRYLGLKTMTIGGKTDEYLDLEYAGEAKLYLPVANLHLISRYSGADLEHAPLHKLGSDKWEKAKRKAANKVHDVAAELLDIYARRAARKGFIFSKDDTYSTFAESFPFEETPDQETAIEKVLEDMHSEKTMDRLVCGDVGFGKTEVAMRAAFVAVMNNKQVAILAPTTLLAQQHFENFKDRFADWPVELGILSRFRTAKEQAQTIEGLKNGRIDIVIGTHKLLSKDVGFKNLGLLIIDEEHRFGVKQKETLKSLRADVDILTLTATPIPRTLNMAFSNIRDLSIIATPPARRLSIKTFVQKRNNSIIREAILREILRGGQVFFLHNNVETIHRVAEELEELVPEARPVIGHGQMRERELEKVMSDFYHRKYNVLIATTIIETGIDIPSANTIIIDRADKFGLAQLHQLRGRVGRSHHQAYAYLLIPDTTSITKDAEKRLEAISSLEDLGVGFMLATHDLEIRGAGELLGDEQSGQMTEIGFTLYMEMLDKAVKSLKKGEKIDLDKPMQHGAEIDLKVSAIIPEDYLPDTHMRLMLYKRIANAENEEALDELKIEMIDRFGLLPEPIKHLFEITSLRKKAEALGIRKISTGKEAIQFEFTEKPNIEPMTIITLIQTHPNMYHFNGADKFRVKFSNENSIETRIRMVNNMLKQFSNKACHSPA